ncbi:glycosyltransferase family 2 protein [Moritella dasanensis]|uniref:glycosyltransferase family 2 protein n=1 Tax=Moritella dasanensis TaxID=428031 RepID=UPI0002F7F522|nr:glycosyltransferase family 2 protein [Moritella dasanensis]
MLKCRNDVAAIIVTHNPNRQELLNLIDKLTDQVSLIHIIDNGSVKFALGELKKINLTLLPSNMGIAHAQNIGLNMAINNGFTDFVLFDQDSLPSDSMISDLLVTRTRALEAEVNVAAVGPVHIDQDNFSESIFIDTSNKTLKKILPSRDRQAGRHFAKCDFLIASGCLISKDSLDIVGYMEDDLFIDCVDIEWGFRALDKGLHCIAAFDAKMYHKIGEAPLKLFGRDLTTHSPVRHYYFYRNFYQLLKRSYVPYCWKRHTFIKSTVQAFVFSSFLSPRFEHFKCIVKGILHGLMNKNGKYE